MSTVKITDLPLITNLDNNTSNTVMVGVDVDNDVTAKFTVTTLAEGLYHNNSLKVGRENITFTNTIAQFSDSGTPFLQINLQNTDGDSSGDYVATADIGTNANNFIDMGINGSTFSDPAYSAMQPLDGYLYVQGSLGNSADGNLVIGTASTGANVIIAPGGTTTSNVVTHFTKNGLVLKNSARIEFTDGSIQTVASAPANYTQSSFNTANSASSNTVIIQGVNLTQNTTIAAINGYAVSAYATANASNGMAVGAYTTANGANGMAVGAYNKANNALANTNNAIFAGNLNIQGNLVAYGIASSNLVSFVSSTTPATNALFEIIGSTSGLQQTPSNDGYMIHVTGKDDVPNRIVYDAFGANSYPLVAGRKGRGVAGAPTAVANNDILMRISSNGWGSTGFAPLGSGRIDFVATENYTDLARGSKIVFYNVVNGTNTINQIATFNANTVEFTGTVNPSKGFIFTPRVLAGAQTAITIDFSNDSTIKATLTADLTFTLSNYTSGKVVEVWLTNTGGTQRTVTHGCSALNSAINSTTFTIPSTSSAYMRYFSVDGDLANTFVSVQHA